MPRPEPRSSTVSPGFSSARAVGFPQPKDARTAASGRSLFWASSYKLLVIGSAPPQAVDGADPQQELPPLLAWRAAWPYFSLTTSLMFSVICSFLILTRPDVIRGGLERAAPLQDAAHEPHAFSSPFSSRSVT